MSSRDKRGRASQKVEIELIAAALLSGSPDCTIDVGSFRDARIFVELVWGAATSVDMEVQAILVGVAATEFIDLTAAYSEAVSANKNFYWDVPVNCSQIKLTFTGGGVPTTDAVTVHASVTD